MEERGLWKCENALEKIMESQNGLGWKGALKAIQPNPPAVSRDIFHRRRLLRAPSSLASDVSRDGASPSSLHNLCQRLTALSVKISILLFGLTLPLFSLKLLPV